MYCDEYYHLHPKNYCTTKQKHNLSETSLSHILLNFGLHVYTCTCDTKEPRTVFNRQQLCSAVTTHKYTYSV